ncbi:threonine ammonia-lyase, biosynthetic [Saccharophagus degradans]|uniref:L-threonine dehydratase n=1 Tax=Saccharophagus degradans TaxID=86304 RepID=A0AAW7XCW2_9GAMM|nr:threonine ammonia-lyase, biosynthetic [Saccharophagus degradans]MBU2986320.1 threonine ammonia-lyase, biosynthetic [Saccharophagus degradans]MDO6424363.1 threonine ammonia-lyase, biosynthetic [Saccharophagus degradans]MDO6608430.1 threonine ammonia-lyase, biosynthetic [Saccharophagus degradans]
MPQTYLKRILDARIYDLAIETPLESVPLISIRTGNNVLLKREDLQPVFSFKIRGAYNKLRLLSEEARKVGVIAASAGNHAQGLALAAKHMGVAATIVMPRTTPAIKVDAVRRRGAKVVLMGDAYDEAAAHAKKLVEEKGLTYIHPFDDPDVIAGQGTVGMEILRQHPGDIDVVFVPVGGGGLCAGVAAYIKHVRPETKVIAVEAEDSACLKLAMDKKRRAVLPSVGIFAEGVAVAQIGKETYRVIKECIDEVITVNTDEMCAAIKDIFEDTRSIAEPAGALSLAGLKKYVARTGCADKTLIAIDSGANTNFDRLRYISERTEFGEKREAIFAVTLPEKPGAYKKFCKDLGKRNITEFNYRYADNQQAHIFVGLQITPDKNDREDIVNTLTKGGYDVVDMTDNEVAKLHVRYMVGGHATVPDEIVYRFEFPERPGALMEFLTKIAGRWNISMFHYRNHGAAFGRVLVGMQVPKGERKDLKDLLDELNYTYWDETQNEAYSFFLG